MPNLSNQRKGAAAKVKDLRELAEILGMIRSQGRKVVLCHGVFDLLHIGHIRHFEQAKELGDVLVVTVTTDGYVNKGPSRPVFNEDLRAEAIAALDCVDYVAISEWPMAVETIQLLRPDFFVKGSEYRDAEKDRTGGIALEAAAVKSAGGQLAFTQDITFSASNLINHHLSIFPKEVSQYLGEFAARYSSDEILGYLEGAGSLKVLVVGETIIDEYLYCQTLGKSAKEPVLATRYLDTERFAGGIVPVANHISVICARTAMLTFLGRSNSQEDFVREKVNAQVDKMFLYMEGDAPTIVKRRYIEAYPFQKLFEVYVMDDGEHRVGDTEALCRKLREVVPGYDVVIVLDYGHGMLGPEAVDILCDQARFLAVNTQMNAGNRGFNTISKYRRADFICLSEHEIRLEARSQRRDLRDIIQEVGTKLSCDQILITRGERGCLAYSKAEGFFDIPAFAVRVVDRIGAGDAVLSLTALCAAQRAPMEIVGFIGNVAGAEAVAVVGHRNSIQRVGLYRHIESLLK